MTYSSDNYYLNIPEEIDDEGQVTMRDLKFSAYTDVKKVDFNG